MRGHQAEIEARGGALALIGSGTPAMARAFRAERELSCPLLCDPELAAFQAAGLRRSVGATFSLGTLKSGWRAYRGGFRQSSVQGDPWQQGGVFVCAPGDETRYAYVSQSAGDHPDPAEFLAALGQPAPNRG